MPLPNAPVMLGFGGTTLAATFDGSTAAEAYPFYTVSDSELGAQRGNTMTMTVTLGNVTATRAFRAEPVTSGENQGEQEIALVLPEQGSWQPWLTGGYTRTLLVDGSISWAGGAAGLLQIDNATGSTTIQSLPWNEQTISALEGASPSTLWAAGPHALAHFDGAAWQNVPPPFAAPIRALAVDPSTGTLWVGGGENSGALARYNGSWQTITAVSQPIMTLSLDDTGNIWAGTWGGGVYRHSGQGGDLNSGWQQLRVNHGLASDYILSALAAGSDLWFGTRPYIAGQGTLGGISHYNSTTNNWRTYTTADGLPTAPDLPSAPARVYALVVDEAGVVWAGTERGVHLLAAPNLWLTDMATTAAVYALAARDSTIIATTVDGVMHLLDRTVSPGVPPTAAFSSDHSAPIGQTEMLELMATALDHDEGATINNSQILAWDWVSDRDGPLCTTANRCTLPAAALSPGLHQITLRVQDDEGVWSAGITTPLTIGEFATTPTATFTATPISTPTVTPSPTQSTPVNALYLPLINRAP